MGLHGIFALLQRQESVIAKHIETRETNPLTRRLASYSEFSEDELGALLALPLKIVAIDADTDLLVEGEKPTQSCVVLSGFLCRYKLLEEGKRQILSFHLPGDMPDLHSFHLPHMDHSLCTLMPSEVAFVSHRGIDELMEKAPKLAAILWRSSLADASVVRQWMANNGRRTARQRIAHVLSELLVRYRSIGLAQDNRYRFPVTQIELGDAVGLSVVHVNRVLKDLRTEGMVTIAGGYVSILDWAALKETAGFDVSYLHLLKGDAWVF